MLDVGLLGPIDARRDGAVLNIGGARQRRLLAYLALAAGRSRSIDGIVRAMWPNDESPADARQSVHSAVSRLRSSFNDSSTVTARGGGYSLEGVRVDSARFNLLLDDARIESDATSRAVLLRTALRLWRGEALEEFAHEEWARADAVRLDEMRAVAEDELAANLLELGNPADAVAELEAAASRSPLRERTHRLLMEALTSSGRQAEALRVFQNYRHRLATDLGLEPGDEIRSVEAAIAGGTSLPRHVGFERSIQSARSYELGELIGRGAFAVVYRGVQPSVGREVAVKVIRSELANQPEFIRRFEAEAQLVARLEHPYIVPLYDSGASPARRISLCVGSGVALWNNAFAMAV